MTRLVDGHGLGVREHAQRGRGLVGDVVAQDQRRLHYAPLRVVRLAARERARVGAADKIRRIAYLDHAVGRGGAGKGGAGRQWSGAA